MLFKKLEIDNNINLYYNVSVMEIKTTILSKYEGKQDL